MCFASPLGLGMSKAAFEPRRIIRTLLLGIDSGTQSTKALVVDARDGKVLASAAAEYDLIPNLPPGAKEQHPHTWRDATASAIRRALRQAKAGGAEVKAIGVSGQQHGFVPLDKDGAVIRPAKLWCDTSTAAECEEITAKLGGLSQTIRALGNAVLPGFTASKILWLKKHEPRNYAQLASVLLPHDYLNFWLTGEQSDGIRRRERHGAAGRAPAAMVARGAGGD